jgi:hypothetical protein
MISPRIKVVFLTIKPVGVRQSFAARVVTLKKHHLPLTLSAGFSFNARRKR